MIVQLYLLQRSSLKKLCGFVKKKNRKTTKKRRKANYKMYFFFLHANEVKWKCQQRHIQAKKCCHLDYDCLMERLMSSVRKKRRIVIIDRQTRDLPAAQQYENATSWLVRSTAINNNKKGRFLGPELIVLKIILEVIMLYIIAIASRMNFCRVAEREASPFLISTLSPPTVFSVKGH